MKDKIRDVVQFIKNYENRSILSNKGTISFNIDFVDAKKLEFNRIKAIENYSLKFIDHDYVNATMTFEGSTFPVKIKLKGSTARDHQNQDKWSFRVNLKGDDRFMGMQSFSMMDPLRRNYLMEWLYRLALKEENVISKKYGFINVNINGRDMGLYAFDEEFNKVMIERNKRREGPIISLKDDSFWIEGAAFKTLSPNKWGDYYLSAPLEVKNSSNNIITKHTQEAMDLLGGFRRGEIPLNKAFDVEKLATSMALGDVFKSSHGFLPFNSVFYYNPITHRLEPIPDDTFNELGLAPDGVFRYADHWVTGIFLEQIVNDFDFAEAYLSELKRIAKKDFIDSLLLKYSEEIEDNLLALRSDISIGSEGELALSPIYDGISILNDILDPHRAVVANLERLNANSITLKIAAKTALPVEILSLSFDDNIVLFPCKQNIRCSKKITGRGYENNLKYTEYNFYLPNENNEALPNKDIKDTLKLNYRILGDSEIRSETIFSYKAFDSNRILQDPKIISSNAHEFNFLDYDQKNNTFKFKSGLWKLEKNLIVPKDSFLYAGPETTIDFVNSSQIVSYSPLDFSGTDVSPVKLVSSDNSGGSLTVFAKGSKSRFNYVLIDGLVNKSDSTGAITFFESPIDIDNSKFFNLNSEDALNIINTVFSINNTIFKNSFSDALDIDFGTGKLINSTFINSGNDSIDLSGSSADIFKVSINNSGDKAISIGEKSNANIDTIDVENCKIGIAVKDNSNTKINNIALNNCEYGFAVYQKKPDFGPAAINASMVKFGAVENKFLVESRSSLQIDGEVIPLVENNVLEKLYENI